MHFGLHCEAGDMGLSPQTSSETQPPAEAPSWNEKRKKKMTWSALMKWSWNVSIWDPFHFCLKWNSLFCLFSKRREWERKDLFSNSTPQSPFTIEACVCFSALQRGGWDSIFKIFVKLIKDEICDGYYSDRTRTLFSVLRSNEVSWVNFH